MTKFNPKNFSLQNEIKKRVNTESLVEWCERDKYMELPTEFPKRVKWTRTSAYAFGRSVVKSLLP